MKARESHYTIFQWPYSLFVSCLLFFSFVHSMTLFHSNVPMILYFLFFYLLHWESWMADSSTLLYLLFHSYQTDDAIVFFQFRFTTQRYSMHFYSCKTFTHFNRAAYHFLFIHNQYLIIIIMSIDNQINKWINSLISFFLFSVLTLLCDDTKCGLGWWSRPVETELRLYFSLDETKIIAQNRRGEFKISIFVHKANQYRSVCSQCSSRQK